MSLADDVPGCIGAEEIGAGGYGQVFKARQPAFDRTVAIKVLHGRLDDADILRRFQRECQAIGAVAGHPNIVGVHDAGGTPSGHPYIVMPYLRRGSLAQRVLRHGPLPWQQAVAITIKLCGALHSAHAAGVLHRDIKPENILVSDYGEPMLADFGIAQRLGSSTQTVSASALTPAQGAPELMADGKPSVASDVYSLGSTVHTLMTGQAPFARRGEESVFPMLARIASAPPPDLRPTGVPDEIARVVEAAMAKEPGARPPTARAFGEALQQAQVRLRVPITDMPVADDADLATIRTPPPPVGNRSPVASGLVAPTPTPTRRGPAGMPGRLPGPGVGYPPGRPAPAMSWPGVPISRPETRPGPPRRRSRTVPLLVTCAGAAVIVAALGVASYVFSSLTAGSITGGSRPTTTASPSLSWRSIEDPSTSSRTRSPASSRTQSPAATGPALTAALFTPTDLGAGWSKNDAASGPASDQAFCNVPLGYSGGKNAAVTLIRTTPVTAVKQDVYAGGASGTGAKVLGTVRSSSTKCTKWNAVEEGDKVAYQVAPLDGRPTLGDDSVEYRVQATNKSLSLHVIQVYVVRGDALSIVSYATLAPSTDADIAAAESLAAKSVDRAAAG